ncbi:MocR-like pyridoxine biosynthesis transcription factor PdxR [Anaeromicropila populeti]|uniref:GntR family transcriptional regulator / MocR family aminotransferase n=1 Tax=Anaeromicropila populeti TaxID=37658 RepID=A0A1I6JS24_9FIRM|nr:PLP-dependent aminotransferase family protein [Anaeromicropila populeti]SFR81765.1 GntR family transcriptional regulator / MocR family aminotransferase [Anaeromicropila populeti]
MLTIPLNVKSKHPLYEQIYLHIKKEIQSGALPVQTKLPSTRGLANHLQVSRNTIEQAYAQLISEGYIESKQKSGYYICQINGLAEYHQTKLTAKQLKAEKRKVYSYDFSPFSVDLTHFPYHTWRQLSKNCLTQDENLFLLGHNQGDDRLRHAISDYLHQSRGVRCTEEQLIIGAGVDYLLQLISILIPRNQLIAMENPSYMRAYRIFKGLGYQTAAIDLDNMGISMEKLYQSNASIAYVTPSHQYPIGIVMPIKRRMELLQWACEEENRYIIEDDHDSEFRYTGKPIPSLQGIAPQDKVIYIGTFSRAIAPAIRVGYMVLPTPLLAQYQSEYSYYSCTVSRIDQAIITNFIQEGYFERHLNRMRKLYKTKHDTLMQALGIFKDNMEICGENAGLYVVVKFKTNVTEDLIIEEAKKNGIRLYGLLEHYIQKPTDNTPTFLIGFANLSEFELQKGIHELYELFKQKNWFHL